METTALIMFQRTVKYEDSLIWIKPLCEFFEISVQNQQRKLKNDGILGNLWIKKSTDLGKIDENGRILLSKKGFLRWIMIINMNTVSENLRPKFIQYQELISDFLYGSFEQENNIRRLYAESNSIDDQMKELARRKRMNRKALNMALYDRYQYSLPFNEQSSISN